MANEYMKSIKDNLDSVEQNLEQIQCDDGISRQQVLDFFKNDVYVCNEVMNMPSVTPKNTVSAEAYEQVMWERDIAIQQLNELGYEFGEKPEMGDTISRQAAIKYLMDNMTWYSEDGYETDEDEKKSAITSLINGVPSIQPVTGKTHVRLGYKYCPSCGCRMEVLE